MISERLWCFLHVARLSSSDHRPVESAWKRVRRSDESFNPHSLRRWIVFVVDLVVEFDFSECERLADTFAIAKIAPLVFVDLAKVSYPDSSALQCFVTLREAACEGAQGLSYWPCME